VQTVFVETGNSSQTAPIVRPSQLGRLIDRAHRRGLRIVAWYLPTLVDPGKDARRSIGAVRFRTRLGQTFDSFALDIESSAVSPVWERNRRLARVSARLRAAVGGDYPLGAIIPAPRGMELSPTYWPNFPYTALHRTYDVFAPMGYYTNRVRGPAAAADYTRRNADIIRTATGDPAVPIHMIGGGAAASTRAEVRGFANAVAGLGLLGGSLYDAATTRPGEWDELAVLRR
jgi:hypothetical protein